MHVFLCVCICVSTYVHTRARTHTHIDLYTQIDSRMPNASCPSRAQNSYETPTKHLHHTPHPHSSPPSPPLSIKPSKDTAHAPYICIRACIYEYIASYICICTCMYEYIDVCMHVCMHACMHLCMHLRMYADVCVCVCVRMCVHDETTEIQQKSKVCMMRQQKCKPKKKIQTSSPEILPASLVA